MSYSLISNEFCYFITAAYFFQMFSFSKVSTVQLLSASHASLLSWSVDPRLARPDVMNNTRVAQMSLDINTVLTRYSVYQRFRLNLGESIKIISLLTIFNTNSNF